MAVACATVGALSPLVRASAADAPVPRVLVVKPTGLATCLKQADVRRALWRKRSAQATLTVRRVTFAGRNAEAIVVGVQFPGMLPMAQDLEALRTNPEGSAEMAEFAPLREVASGSLYEELSH